MRFAPRGSRIEKRALTAYDKDVCFIFVDPTHFWSASNETILHVDTDKDKFLKFNPLSLLENDAFFNFSDAQKETICNYKRFIREYYSASQKRQEIAKKEIKNADAKKARPRASFPENHGKPWNRELIAKLVEEYYCLRIIYSYDSTVELLAQQFDRSAESIRIKLEEVLTQT